MRFATAFSRAPAASPDRSLRNGAAAVRLFVAVWPPPELVAAVEALPRPVARSIRWTRPDQWHVTLRFLGQVGEEAVEPLAAALAEAAGAVGPTAATLGPATSRFGRGILVVPVSGLAGLASATVRATAAFGEPPDPRPFSGHLTLARAARGGDVRPLAGAPIAGTWIVDELTLVRSTTSREGASYDVVERWPLG